MLGRQGHRLSLSEILEEAEAAERAAKEAEAAEIAAAAAKKAAAENFANTLIQDKENIMSKIWSQSNKLRKPMDPTDAISFLKSFKKSRTGIILKTEESLDLRILLLQNSADYKIEKPPIKLAETKKLKELEPAERTYIFWELLLELLCFLPAETHKSTRIKYIQLEPDYSSQNVETEVLKFLNGVNKLIAEQVALLTTGGRTAAAKNLEAYASQTGTLLNTLLAKNEKTATNSLSVAKAPSSPSSAADSKTPTTAPILARNSPAHSGTGAQNQTPANPKAQTAGDTKSDKVRELIEKLESPTPPTSPSNNSDTTASRSRAQTQTSPKAQDTQPNDVRKSIALSQPKSLPAASPAARHNRTPSTPPLALDSPANKGANQTKVAAIAARFNDSTNTSARTTTVPTKRA